MQRSHQDLAMHLRRFQVRQPTLRIPFVALAASIWQQVFYVCEISDDTPIPGHHPV